MRPERQAGDRIPGRVMKSAGVATEPCCIDGIARADVSARADREKEGDAKVGKLTATDQT